MKATITVDMDNQAFEEDPGRELARILRYLADEAEAGLDPLPVSIPARDFNGNKVGSLEVTP